jgi:hypothetical protein
MKLLARIRRYSRMSERSIPKFLLHSGTVDDQCNTGRAVPQVAQNVRRWSTPYGLVNVTTNQADDEAERRERNATVVSPFISQLLEEKTKALPLIETAKREYCGYVSPAFDQGTNHWTRCQPFAGRRHVLD